MAAATAAFLSSTGASFCGASSVVLSAFASCAAFLALARAMAAATADFLSSGLAGSSLCAFCSLYCRACSLRNARSFATSLLSGSSASPCCFLALARAIAAATADFSSLLADLLLTLAKASATFCFSSGVLTAGLRLWRFCRSACSRSRRSFRASKRSLARSALIFSACCSFISTLATR